MNLAFFRLSDLNFVQIVLSAFVAFSVWFFPNYQQFFYQNTEVREYNEYHDNTGYPAGEGYMEIQSVADMENLNNFTITLDVEQLEETGYYPYLTQDGYVRGAVGRFLMNNCENGIGQMFVATLASGERIMVLLDDTTIGLPKEGTVTLPVGKCVSCSMGHNVTALQKELGLSESCTGWYVDAAGNWRESAEAKGALYWGFLVAMIGVVITCVVVYKVNKKYHIFE